MHRLMIKFAELVSEGEIKDFKPIPNNVFTYEELEYLYINGLIYESNNQFIAVIPSSF